MRRLLTLVLVCLLAHIGGGVASAAVEVVFGASWDGPTNELQDIVDATYGVGHISVTTDYIGAKSGDPDPFFWLGENFSTLLIREIAGHASSNVLGWYLEDGAFPAIDGIGDGVVFVGADGQGSTEVVTFARPLERFGFYLDPNGQLGIPHAPQGEHFFTNRTFNDEGPDGAGALHAPAGGDVQALVYDVSVWTEPNTWLVCFEDLDSGQNTSSCCSSTDNDFNDLVFQVTAMGATPVRALSFGGLKAKYR